MQSNLVQGGLSFAAVQDLQDLQDLKDLAILDIEVPVVSIHIIEAVPTLIGSIAI